MNTKKENMEGTKDGLRASSFFKFLLAKIQTVASVWQATTRAKLQKWREIKLTLKLDLQQSYLCWCSEGGETKAFVWWNGISYSSHMQSVSSRHQESGKLPIHEQMRGPRRQAPTQVVGDKKAKTKLAINFTQGIKEMICPFLPHFCLFGRVSLPSEVSGWVMIVAADRNQSSISRLVIGNAILVFIWHNIRLFTTLTFFTGVILMVWYFPNLVCNRKKPKGGPESHQRTFYNDLLYNNMYYSHYQGSHCPINSYSLVIQLIYS